MATEPSGLTYQWEQWHAIAAELMPMMRAYWNHEGSVFGKELPLDPDFDALMFLYNLGRLKIFTVRRGDLLIGLNSFQRWDDIMASNDCKRDWAYSVFVSV